MAMTLGQEMFDDLAATMATRKNILILTRSDEEAERAGIRLREVLIETAIQDGFSAEKALAKIKAQSQNPSFVQMSSGPWAFFNNILDLEADEPIGNPDMVLWPTEGGTYEPLIYRAWQIQRRSGLIYRPPTPIPRTDGPQTAWARLIDEDDGI